MEIGRAGRQEGEVAIEQIKVRPLPAYRRSGFLQKSFLPLYSGDPGPREVETRAEGRALDDFPACGFRWIPAVLAAATAGDEGELCTEDCTCSYCVDYDDAPLGRHRGQVHKTVKCPHGRQRYFCKECGGPGLCSHGRRKRVCKECGGKLICSHGRQKYSCKECGGSSICPHGRRRQTCKECGGSSICIHGKDRRCCKECSPCPHGSIKSWCKECGGRTRSRQKNRCPRAASEKQGSH